MASVDPRYLQKTAPSTKTRKGSPMQKPGEGRIQGGGTNPNAYPGVDLNAGINAMDKFYSNPDNYSSTGSPTPPSPNGRNIYGIDDGPTGRGYSDPRNTTYIGADGGRSSTPASGSAASSAGTDNYGNQYDTSYTPFSQGNSGSSAGANSTVTNPGGGTNKSEGGQGEGEQTGVKDPGSYNFQQIMDDFYKYEPNEDDAEGRSYKLGLAGDMISKGFDSDLAEKMAYTQAGISKDMMSQQADLDMRNQSEARAQEFGYGMQSMGAQFEHQNNFANSQYDRDVGMLAATGEQDRKNITAAGVENRLGDIVKGEQSRLNIGAQGQQDRANITTQGNVDVTKIGAQGTEDRANISTQQIMQGAREQANIGAQGTQDRANIKTQQQAQSDRETENIRVQGDSDRQSIQTQQSSQGERERGNISTQGSEDRQSIGAQGDQDVRKIGAQGDDNRQTMEKEDELTAKKSNRQAARSRSLARAF